MPVDMIYNHYLCEQCIHRYVYSSFELKWYIGRYSAVQNLEQNQCTHYAPTQSFWTPDKKNIEKKKM